jgi:outer membrane protein assembly factor BamB
VSLIRPSVLSVLPIVVVAFGFAPTRSSAEEPWPSFRGADGTGRALEVLPPGNGPLALKLRWKRELGSGYSGISIAEGHLVTAFKAGERDVVVGLDPKSGEERWRYDLAPVHGGHDGSADGPIATPAIADGRVFVLSPWGHLAALEVHTGTPQWTIHLVDDLGSEKPLYGFGSSPVVVGDMLVLPVGGKEGALAGFDAATGALRWRSVEDEILFQSAVVADVAGHRQVLVLATNTLVGLNPADGAVLWSLEHGGGERAIKGALTQSPLLVGDDHIFIKQDDSTTSLVEVTAGPSGWAATLLRTGRGLHRSYSPPTVWGGQAYGYTNRLLSALDLETGELLWRSRKPGDGFLVALDGHLAVLTKEGSLHLGPASPEGWKETTSLQLFRDLAWTPPSVGAGGLYLRSLGEIARVDIVRAAAAADAAEADSDVRQPAALAGLAAEVRAAEDPNAVVDRFLVNRELPLVDGEEVVFVWRGDAQDVAVAGDMIGMRREERMQRLPGTDLWWWSTALDRRARISYLFFVDYAPRPDTSHERRAMSTVLGPDMNWNPGEPMEVSWFAMPEWPGRALGSAGTPTKGGRIERVDLTVAPPGKAAEPITVTTHVWLPPGYDDTDDRYPVVFVHDNFAREIGQWVETLDRVVGRSVEPLLVVFVEPPRMRGYPRAFAEELVPAIDARFRTRADRDHRANVGMGWGCHDASLIAFQNPERFGRLGLQSHYALDEDMNGLRRALGNADASAVPLRIYLEWGRWDLISPHEEMNFRASAREVWDLFRERGWDPIGGEVWDSTDFASWSNRTDVLLQSLFPLDGKLSSATLARWATGEP